MEICLARSCSASDGTLTSQERKDRSSMIADHCEVSQLMSRALVRAAHGCLRSYSSALSCCRGECSSPAQEHDNGITFGGNKSEHEHVLATTVVAYTIVSIWAERRERSSLTFWHRFTQSTLLVKHDLFVLRFDEVVYNMRGGCVTSGVAKPLVAGNTLCEL